MPCSRVREESRKQGFSVTACVQRSVLACLTSPVPAHLSGGRPRPDQGAAARPGRRQNQLRAAGPQRPQLPRLPQGRALDRAPVDALLTELLRATIGHSGHARELTWASDCPTHLTAIMACDIFVGAVCAAQHAGEPGEWVPAERHHRHPLHHRAGGVLGRGARQGRRAHCAPAYHPGALPC